MNFIVRSFGADFRKIYIFVFFTDIFAFI